MIINHNMASLNTYRQMSTNMTNTSKSLEKLSSGLRINKAGDDAAGLAISEKMRGQIRGLDQAARNGQDGISLLNTAEGALSETHSILQRMKELATQSANDTNTTSDRSEIQKEINQLTSEINRIGNTTEFNTQKLLNGGGKAVSVVNAGKLDIPAQLSGGQAGAVTQLGKTFTVASSFGATDDGKTITFNLGGKDVTLTLNKNLTSANSTATQIGISDTTTATSAANAIERALTLAIAGDAELRDKYSMTADLTDDVISLDAKALSFSAGVLKGTDAGINGSITYSASDSFTAATITESIDQAGAGSYASASIDFTGKTVADLKGTGFVIGGKKVDLYDSTDGAYTGNADFAVDMKGAGSAEAIVDKVVSALYNNTGADVSKFGVTVAANSSYMPDVYVSKDGDNANKLVITAKTSGTDGNDIILEDNSNNDTSNLIGSDKLSGESVVSAQGLKDGQQTVTVSYKAATATESSTVTGAITAGNFTVTANSTVAFDSGSYRLTNAAGSTANHAQLQKLGSDGSTWSTVAGYEDITLVAGNNTIGDLTVNEVSVAADNFTNAGAGTDVYEFTIAKQHYEATLTEKDGTAGTAVTVTSGEQNVLLKAQDGVGEAVVNMGDISGDLAIGASTTFNFNTSAAKTTEVTGGKFEATFQIGANTAQSMTVEVNDMRSQSLKVSGISAGGSVTASNGTVATLKETKEVTNGTNNTSTEYALDVSTSEKATAAISVLDDAIQSVSAERSKIGAYTNRLDHTITNLGTSSENLTAAESRVRDVDMAKEMMQFQKNNILSQAAQAMMAQANQQPQGVLQLLR